MASLGFRRAISCALLALGTVQMLGGCAGVSYRTIDSEEANLKAKGLRYYDSSPYLLVQTDGAGGLKSEIQYLPDLTKRRQATPYTFLSANTTSLTFVDGILTDTSSDVDETAVPVAVVSALKQIGTEAAKAAFDTARSNQPEAAELPPSRAPRVYLFKIVKRDVIDPKDGTRKREWGLVGASGGDVKYRSDDPP